MCSRRHLDEAACANVDRLGGGGAWPESELAREEQHAISEIVRIGDDCAARRARKLARERLDEAAREPRARIEVLVFRHGLHAEGADFRAPALDRRVNRARGHEEQLNQRIMGEIDFGVNAHEEERVAFLLTEDGSRKTRRFVAREVHEMWIDSFS